MREITPKLAEEFVSNYKAMRDPRSFSYNDNYAGAWSLEQTMKHGFKTEKQMYEASLKVLKTAKPPVVPKKQRMRIEVIKFMGKNGAFAACETEMYKTELVGVNGKRENINDWQTEGSGYSDSKYANQDAAKWAALLGCKIVFVDTTAKKKAA